MAEHAPLRPDAPNPTNSFSRMPIRSVGSAFDQVVGRPQSCVASTDDGDINVRVTRQFAARCSAQVGVLVPEADRSRVRAVRGRHRATDLPLGGSEELEGRLAPPIERPSVSLWLARRRHWTVDQTRQPLLDARTSVHDPACPSVAAVLALNDVTQLIRATAAGATHRSGRRGFPYVSLPEPSRRGPNGPARHQA